MILAGVHAWGESPLEQVCARPLLPVVGRPLVSYILEWLCSGGITESSICANSDTPAFQSCLASGERLGLRLTYVEDVMPRGPAGCLLDAAAKCGADTFVVLDGALIPQFDLAALIEAHDASGAAVTMVVSDPRGRMEGGREAKLEPVGIYVVSRTALAYIPERGYQDIKEVWIPRLYESGARVIPYVVDRDATLRVVDAASYVAACNWALQRSLRSDAISDEYLRVGQSLVHRSAEVAASARLVGAVVVGPNCRIEAAATVVGPATIGQGARVCRNAVVSGSMIWSGCIVGPQAFVIQSILVDQAKVESGDTVRGTVLGVSVTDRSVSSREVAYWGEMGGEPRPTGMGVGFAAAG
ncbi:MAG: NDP-sugar synthase [Phycisphaerae bacterium]|nr:NDP-sugar synthase [Phycisphaerae bacterium]